MQQYFNEQPALAGAMPKQLTTTGLKISVLEFPSPAVAIVEPPQEQYGEPPRENFSAKATPTTMPASPSSILTMAPTR